MDAIIDIEDLRKLKLPELKALCKQNKLPSSGAKEALIKRLAVSMGMDDEDEGVDEDALLEDEDELDSKEDTPVSVSDKVRPSCRKKIKSGVVSYHSFLILFPVIF